MKKFDSDAGTTCRSTRRLEPAHPRDDDRVSFCTQVNRREDSEVYNRADVVVSEDQSKAWRNNPNLPENRITSSARTTFYPREISIENHRRRKRLNRMWKRQMGLGHIWVDDSDRKTLVRQKYTLQRCDVILQQCYVPKWIRTPVLSRIHQTNLNGFSRHYKGADGACIGFTLLMMCTNPEEAKATIIANRAPSVIPDPDFDEETVEKVIDYVFRKYGREC